MQALVKRKIVFRIVLGYLLALSFTVGIVFLAFSGLDRINNAVNDIAIRLTNTRTLTQAIDNKLQLVRYYADRYQRLYRQEDLDLFREKMVKLQDKQREIGGVISDQATLDMVQHIQKETVQYIDNFEEITQLIMYQQMLLSTAFLKQELLVENQLSAIRINVGSVQVPNIYFSFGNARISFELMRLYQSKYMSENDEKYFVMFKNEYQLASNAFSDLIRALNSASKNLKVIKNAEKAQNELKVYYKTFLDIHSASISLRKLSKKLERNEFEVVETASKIALVVEGEYERNNQLTQRLVHNTQFQLLAAVIIAILINFGLIWVVLRKIITPIFHELQQLSNIDSLTNVANRRAFDIGIKKEAERAKREKYPLSLILCDVDFFKKYNDSYGHQQGDECLIKIAKTLSNQCRRSGDFIARYGGEEFIIILQNTSSEKALSIANKLVSSIETLGISHNTSSVSRFVTISMGVTTMTVGDCFSIQKLINYSDKALYEAKSNKRNCAVLYS